MGIKHLHGAVRKHSFDNFIIDPRQLREGGSSPSPFLDVARKPSARVEARKPIAPGVSRSVV